MPGLAGISFCLRILFAGRKFWFGELLVDAVDKSGIEDEVIGGWSFGGASLWMRPGTIGLVLK